MERRLSRARNMIYDLADNLKWCGRVSYSNGLLMSSIQLGDPLGLPIDSGGRVYFSHYAFGSSAGRAGARGPGRGAACVGAAGLRRALGGAPAAWQGKGGAARTAGASPGIAPSQGRCCSPTWGRWVPVPAPAARSCPAGCLRCYPRCPPAASGRARRCCHLSLPQQVLRREPGRKRFISQVILPPPRSLNKGGGRAREDRLLKLVSTVF